MTQSLGRMAARPWRIPSGGLLIWLALIVTSPASASEPSAISPVQIAHAERWDIHSKITQRIYRIFVLRPSQRAPEEGLPLFLLTDADVFFPQAAGQMLIRTLGELRQALVVGISYPTSDVAAVIKLRNRDLTPTKFAPSDLSQFKALGITYEDSGGSEAFYRFITEELRPQLAARYGYDPRDQTLFGHSLGGLFTLHVLFNHPSSFRNFVAASPSIWWNDRAILKDLPGFQRLVAAGKVSPRVLITVGEAEGDVNAVPVSPIPRDEIARQVAGSREVENVSSLLAALRGIAGTAPFEVSGQVFEGENHLSVQPASLSRALGFALAKPTFGHPCVYPCVPAGKKNELGRAADHR